MRGVVAALVVEVLERLAGESPTEIRSRLVSDWVEHARAAAADRLRRVEASINDPEHVRSAKRITRTVSFVVRRLPGCGEKITASLHLIA